VPPSPTASTSLPEVPQAPINAAVVPLGCVVQLAPFQCRMVPASPTANTSLAELPHRPNRSALVGLDWMDQVVPL